MIGVHELLKRRGDRVVLAGVSFEADASERIAVVGPSGGGKTTLLRCMHGLEPFDSGRVRIGDAQLGPGAPKPAPLAAIRARAGFVFQQWHLFAHMSAIENVIEAPVHVRKEPRKQAIARAEMLLDKVGLSHRKDARPRSLSGGEQQRVAIARALAMQPEVLFMDEPTSALDPQRVGSLVELLGQLSEEDGLTLVMVTHDIGFARELATHALVLADGEVADAGAPAEVLTSPSDPRTRAFLGLAD